MNGKKFEEIRQEISLVKYIERKSTEPAQEFSENPNSFKQRIEATNQEINRERQIIEREFSSLKTPKSSPLEKISFPDPLPPEAEKILAHQSEILKDLATSQADTERKVVASKNSFAERKAALHKKFLEFKGG